MADSVALNLAPLLTPHRKQGRLSVRVERMPQGTRLSRGTRNNDGTWSLASDELDDLAVLMPANAQKDFKICVRVISLINGSTLVTVDVPIKPGDDVASASVVRNDAAMPSPADAAELSVLRRELAVAKEALAARDTELAERLAAAAADASNLFQQTLAKAEAGWTESENARLAAIQQQWQDKFAEALSEIEAAQTETHQAQVRELQEKIESVQAALDQSNAALAQAKLAGASARERGDNATQDARSKLAELEAKLAEREAALARAATATDTAKRDAAAALAKAEQAWRDGEAARLAAAEAQWRDAAAKALEEAHAGAQALHAKGTASEQDLLNRVAELQAALAERDEALTRAQAANEQTRATAAQDVTARLAAAEANWKAAETARLAALEAAWRTKLGEAAKAAPVQTAAASAPANEAELQDLRDKLAALQAKLTLRDAASARAAKLSEDERRRWQKEAQDVIVKATRERKSEENARLAAAQSEWTKQSVRELALITARAEAAEAALTQLRIRATEEAPLQREVASLRSALAIREAELEHYRGALPSEDETAPAAEATTQPQAPNQRVKRMVRDALIAACIGVVAVILWPLIGSMRLAPPAPPPAAPVVAAIASAPVFTIAVASKDAKLRATPSLYGDIIGKLPRDAKVERIETKGDWTRVRRTEPPAKGEPAEGWARTSVLKEAPEEPAKPAKRKKK